MRGVDNGVGNKLREARTRRKLTLQEVEAATKIRSRYLLAIENEDWDQLPGDTYARAFIRTYGALVGLDGDRLADEQRRQRGTARPGESLPRADPKPRLRSGAIAIGVSALVVVALLVVGLSGGGEPGGPGTGGKAKPARDAGSDRPRGEPAKSAVGPSGHTLELLAKGEVWVCLLGGGGGQLVGGDILAAGEAAGPFRSGSFTLALGNGAVTMTVDGKQMTLPEPSSPIGFTVDSQGSVQELPEGERPTCT
ncbi:MAG TPA: helix-turn-helix transcriptional regulator [Solirubrobacterales bacterium]